MKVIDKNESFGRVHEIKIDALSLRDLADRAAFTCQEQGPTNLPSLLLWLQIKIEALAEVERAFVHIDWEWEHRPGVDGQHRM